MSSDAAPNHSSVEPVIGSDALVLALANAIAAGQVRPTVAKIRRYLRCLQRTTQRQLRLVPTAIAPRLVHARPRLVHSELIARVA
ncbi:hypothetical protein [Burkholderia ubonensis]|uniref:hypothetical protein n=1 Tax=Burkholderia ubonensis TaxID=101571 RepID=UPI0012F82FF4|nr:hypothetical protein [Burkholderia ubonensis]